MKKKSRKNKPALRFVAPPPDEVKKFEEQASFIEDDEVREALTQSLVSSKGVCA